MTLLNSEEDNTGITSRSFILSVYLACAEQSMINMLCLESIDSLSIKLCRTVGYSNEKSEA